MFGLEWLGSLSQGIVSYERCRLFLDRSVIFTKLSVQLMGIGWGAVIIDVRELVAWTLYRQLEYFLKLLIEIFNILSFPGRISSEVINVGFVKFV